MNKPALVLTPGTNVLVSWEANPQQPGSVKSNRINGQRTKKIVLADNTADGAHPKPNENWVCRIEKITNPKSDRHGSIIVKPLTMEIDGKFPNVWVDPEKARLMAIVLQTPGKNLMLEGDQGIGKSTIARAVADSLGWEFRKINCGQIKKFNFMYGRFRHEIDKDGHPLFVWVDSQLARVLREAMANPPIDFLVVYDEFSRMEEDARDALLEVIEGDQKTLTLPNGEVLKIGRNVHNMGAANVGDGFTIKKEDAAAKDRWAILKIEVMPQEAELEHCLKKFPRCPKAELDRALTIINVVRKSKNDPNLRLSKSVSTRAAQNVAMYLGGGVAIETALLNAVANQFAGNIADDTTEQGKVARIIRDQLKNQQAKKEVK